MTIIRKASLEDLNNIYKLDKQCFKSENYSKTHWKELIEKSKTFTAIDKITNNIIGIMSTTKVQLNDKTGGITDLFMTNNKIKKCWLIVTICVDMHYRKSGVGTLLIENIKNILNKSKYPILLNVRKSNDCAIKFYKKHGFKIYKQKDIGYYDNPKEDGLLMYYSCNEAIC